MEFGLNTFRFNEITKCNSYALSLLLRQRTSVILALTTRYTSGEVTSHLPYLWSQYDLCVVRQHGVLCEVRW